MLQRLHQLSYLQMALTKVQGKALWMSQALLVVPQIVPISRLRARQEILRRPQLIICGLLIDPWGKESKQQQQQR